MLTWTEIETRASALPNGSLFQKKEPSHEKF